MTTNDKGIPRSWRRSVTATRTSILLTVFLYLAIPVLADNNDYRIEVFGSVGASEYIVIWGPPARGINLGGGIGVRPFSQERSWIIRGLGGEFEMNVTRGISNRIVQSYYTGNLLYHLLLTNICRHWIPLVDCLELERPNLGGCPAAWQNRSRNRAARGRIRHTRNPARPDSQMGKDF
jgi:hypothetical protein